MTPAGRIRGAIARKTERALSPLTWRDLFGVKTPFQGAGPHLAAATDWLSEAIGATGGEGVAAHYTVGVGWGSAYPETTGYIIPTLFAVADRLGRPDLEQKAVRLAEWLLTTQRPSGGFPGGEIRFQLEETVFNTGQIIRGLISAWQHTQDAKLLDAAVRAGEWLLSVQSPDGAWRDFTSPLTTTREHAYDILTAFALFRLGRKGGRPAFCEAALRQYEWTLGQQLRTGFFHHASFEADEPPLTHSLAYVAEGLYRFSKEAEEPRGADACHRLMVTLEGLYGDRARLPGRLDEELEPAASWSCVTGNLQFGWVALRLGRAAQDRVLAKWGRKLIEAAAATQVLDSAQPGVRGGVFGSTPVYGRYYPYSALNWAAKYMIDALLEIHV